MADKTINVRLKEKIDTESNWTSNNPVLLEGEKGLIKGTAKYKIGDGTSKWEALPIYEGMTSSDRSKLDGIDYDSATGRLHVNSLSLGDAILSYDSGSEAIKISF